MRCSCGYPFHEHAMDDPPSYASFAVIRDDDYRKFVRLEKKVLESRGAARDKAIAKSAQYVGSLVICPDCSRLVWNRTDTETREVYIADPES